MDDVYNNINNLQAKRKILIVLDDMITDLWLIKNFKP